MPKTRTAALAVFAFAATVGSVQAAEAGKDMCLVYGTNCPQASDSLPEKIAKLEGAIKKGRAVYTEEELAKLERNLRDAKSILRNLMRPGD